MKDRVAQALAFARHAIDSEVNTRAGRLNGLLIVLGFVVIVISGATDLLQVVIRIWKPAYTTGLPSAVGLFAIWLTAGLICVASIAALTPRRD